MIKISEEQGRILKKAIDFGIDDEELGSDKKRIFKEIDSGNLPESRWFVILDAVGTAGRHLNEIEKEKIDSLLVQARKLWNESGVRRMEEEWDKKEK
jgi:hypothetical protein